jgi:hypothetical protein
MGARNRVEIGLSYSLARLYVGWRNCLFGIGIDFWATYKFKNSGSVCAGEKEGKRVLEISY